MYNNQQRDKPESENVISIKMNFSEDYISEDKRKNKAEAIINTKKAGYQDISSSLNKKILMRYYKLKSEQSAKKIY